MPPDVLAAVSEQQVTCAEGQINIALDEFNTSVIQSINNLFVSSCTDATINLINDPATADIVISDGAKENESIVVCGHRPSLPALAEAISQVLNCEELDATLPPGGVLVIHRDLSNKNKPVRNVEKFIVVE